MRSGVVRLAAVALLAAAAADETWVPGPDDLAPLRRSGSVETYTADNLWERIDGEAELYRRFGLTGAEIARFDAPGDPDRSLELSVFRVGSSLEAFGLFASFRDPARAEEALGNGGQVGDALAFFWQGAIFVHLYASGPEASRRTDLRRAAEAVSRRLGPPPQRPPPLARFEAVVDPTTVRYLPDHLLGRETLPAGFEGTTREGVRVAASAGQATLDGYAGVLEAPRRTARGDLQLLAGTDPSLGIVALAAQGGRIAAALAPALDEETVRLLRSLLAE